MSSAIFVHPENPASAIYKDFLPAALTSGQFKPAPEPTVIGKGLEHLQRGIDKLRKGVSASKLVVVLSAEAYDSRLGKSVSLACYRRVALF